MADTVLVTGGVGFIGSHLSEALLSSGRKVRILDDLSTGRLENLEAVSSDVELVRGSILDRELVAKAMNGCTAVFHLAAVVSVQLSVEKPIETHRVNSEGTLIVVEEAARHGTRVIFSSSAAVYGDSATPPVSEQAAAAPISPYGAQKHYGENLIRAYSRSSALKGISLRYFNVYGSHQDPSSPYSGVISIFDARIRAGEPITIFGDGNQTRDFIHVSDIVRANLAAIDVEPSNGLACNIGVGKASTLLQLAQMLMDFREKRVEIIHREPRPGDILHSTADISLAKQLLHYCPQIELSEGIRQL